MMNRERVMKWGSKALLLATAVSTTMACASPRAGYYRVWQGFKKPDLAEKTFSEKLPAFMDATVILYGDAEILNQYIVVMPPEGHPEFIPDELALVALKDEDSYKKVRQTPEGTRYSESHWEIFDKSRSASSKRLVDYSIESPTRLESGVTYSMFEPKLDWSQGHTQVFIGTRKNKVTKDDFLQRMKNHIELARDLMGPLGLQGYMVIAHENYEVAYLNWQTKELHDRAIESEAGKTVFGDAQDFIDPLMYSAAQNHVAGEQVEPGKAYLVQRPVARALIVVTSHKDLGNTGNKTGYYFPEVTHPYRALMSRNIRVDIASIQGGEAPMDPNSLDLKDSVNAELFKDIGFMSKLKKTQKLAEINSTQYQAIIFAGGHGTMWDFRNSAEIQKSIRSIFENNGVVAAVCHGPSALVDVTLSNGRLLLQGKRVTGFTNEEEDAVNLTQVVPCSLENEMIADGAKFQSMPKFQKHVIVDGRIITGQNPASAQGVGEAVAEILSKKR